ncbi:(d)CMP kinase [bacterium]|nr:(d)CMP kinase [bacterium]
MSARKLIITLDGPAGSGKSTTAKQLAMRLGYAYLDTGAMYRAITLMVLSRKVNPSIPADVVCLLPEIQIDLTYAEGVQKTILNGKDVSEDIRSVEVTKHVSAISSIREVRQFLVKQQQAIGKPGGYVIDGRDAGTVIFPDADKKFFLTADIETRARRRQKELESNNVIVPFNKMAEEIHARDSFDESRDESPLVIPADAMVIDNSNMTPEEQVDYIIRLIQD